MTFLCEKRMEVQCNFSLGKWTCDKAWSGGCERLMLSGFVLCSEKLGLHAE